MRDGGVSPSRHHIQHRATVASRTFEDSSGILWEVLEVHRASEAPRGVSVGLEKGWLSFASANGNRRLAPFPDAWQSASVSELERLCRAARVAKPARYPTEQRQESASAKARSPDPLDARARRAEPEFAEAREPERVSLVRDVVRVFAHDARAQKLPAIDAMVRLKALLAERYGGPDVEPDTRADATDMRCVRRWFVEAFYFERPA